MNLRGQSNQEEKEIKPTDYMLKNNSQQKSTPDAHIRHQQVGADREEGAALLRVRTRPECPEGNRRELT